MGRSFVPNPAVRGIYERKREERPCDRTRSSKCGVPGLGVAGLAFRIPWLQAEVMARQGFDALCVDLQHGTAEMKDVLPMLQAISQTDTVPVVRVAWNEPAAIMKALDLGAYAVIVPLVNNAEEAALRWPHAAIRRSACARTGRCARCITAAATTWPMPMTRSSSWP